MQERKTLRRVEPVIIGHGFAFACSRRYCSCPRRHLGPPAAQRRRHPGRRPGLGRPERPRQHEPAHAEHRFACARTARRSTASSSARSARRRGPSSSPAATTRAAACAASRPGRSGWTSTRRTHRRRLQGRGLRDRRVRQMAQRQPVAVSPERPRLRRVLRLHLRPLGRVLRPAAGSQRQARARQGLHRRRPDRPRDGVHREEQGSAVLLLRAVQHAALADCRCRTSTGSEFKDKPIEAARGATAAGRPGGHARARWRCARTSTGTSAACWRSSTS